jgi:hypothetical protein
MRGVSTWAERLSEAVRGPKLTAREKYARRIRTLVITPER